METPLKSLSAAANYSVSLVLQDDSPFYLCRRKSLHFMGEFNIPKSNFNLIKNNNKFQILKCPVKRDTFIGCERPGAVCIKVPGYKVSS